MKTPNSIIMRLVVDRIDLRLSSVRDSFDLVFIVHIDEVCPICSASNYMLSLFESGHNRNWGWPIRASSLSSYVDLYYTVPRNEDYCVHWHSLF